MLSMQKLLLEEREIAKETVEELIRDPQQVIKGKGNKQIVQGIMNRANQESLLRVVYIEAAGTTKVITAYWTSKMVNIGRESDES